MTTLFFSKSRYSGVLGLLALSASVAQGCGSDSNPAPTPPTVTGGTNTGGSGAKGGSGDTGNESGTGAEGGTGTGAKGGTGTGAKGGTGTGAKGGTGTGAKGGTGNTGNESGTGNEGGTGDVSATGGTSNNQGGAGAGNESCDPVGDYACYPCPPTTNVQYLNRCNDTKCSKFDNATRIENYTGTLPPL